MGAAGGDPVSPGLCPAVKQSRDPTTMRRMTAPLKLSAILLLSILSFFPRTRAQPGQPVPVLIEVIVRSGCPHCQAEKEFLRDLAQGRRDLELRFHDIATPEGAALFKRVVERERLSWSLPITLIGGELLQGFDAPETTGARMIGMIERNRGRTPQGFAAYLARPPDPPATSSAARPAEPFYLHLPLLGAQDAAAWSLPLLAVVLGFLDGFNPCAMWVLATFLVALAQIDSPRRMWRVAGLFILAETVMYFLILNAWFKVWDFVGLDSVVTPLVGLLAMAGGLFFLYEWFKSLGTALACRVVDFEQRSRIVRRIHRISSGEFSLVTALAVIGLAFSVNVIEFACSIGYPQAFTKIVEMNRLGFVATEALIGLYTLFYMADDFVLFGLALWSFGRLRMGQEYSRWSALVGGAVMILLGAMLLLRPDLLKV